MWIIPKIWDGGDVWILGGGPSVSKQFDIPQEVIQSVMENNSTPDTLSSYMSAIHTKHVIGINAAYLLGDWIDIIFFGDKNFLLAHDKGLAKSPSLKVSSSDYCIRYVGIKHTPTDNKHREGISTRPGHVAWNNNSGAASISLAVQLGAKRIFLLGFDMKLDDAANTHWHNIYPKVDSAGVVISRNPFPRHLKGFPAIKTDADKLGVQIYNVNLDSAIKEFPKITLKEALALCK